MQKFWRFFKIQTMSLKVRNQILIVTMRSCPPAIENPESNKVPVPFEDAGGDGGRPTVDEVQEFCGSWKAASHFTPPGPAVCFDESQPGVQRPLPFPMLQVVSDRGAGGRHSRDQSLCFGATGKERARSEGETC